MARNTSVKREHMNSYVCTYDNSMLMHMFIYIVIMWIHMYIWL